MLKLWIARNEDKSLWIYNKKPLKSSFAGFYYSPDGRGLQIDKLAFPEITFKAGPRLIDLSILKPLFYKRKCTK